MTLSRLLSGILFSLLSLTANANSLLPLDNKDVPDPLKSWIPWALQGYENADCPYIYNQANATICAWATDLGVNLHKSGGHFTQQWEIFAPSWLRLPGDQRHWPQNIRVNGKSTAVTPLPDQSPGLFIKKGRVRIEGEFVWDTLPETLSLPANTGIVSLTLNGKDIQLPIIDEQHRLWLSKSTGAEKQDESDKIDLQVFRKISDDIPMSVHTRLQLKVTGKQREVLLGPVPINHFIPVSLNSPLPAKLESNGQLRVQVRPGVWYIDIVSRSVAQMELLTFDSRPDPWPPQELWVFAAQNNYRLVDINNPSIDARQTNLPDDWKTFPAYLLNRDAGLKIDTIRRGNPEPEPDQLSLQRDLWLDFNGNGYTFRDAINGTITSGWRLETEALLNLGRVSVNGAPQFITRLDKTSTKSGIEVRRGQLNLNADGRINSDQRALPVAGWDKEFRTIQTYVHLPPGWTAFYATGTDNQPDTILQRWSLLDLFLVLVISVAIARLWSVPWGIFALVTMFLIWHQADAPHYTWLNLLIAIALVKVLPENRFAKWIRAYRHMSLLLLILFLVPFLIAQARIGLHPQLEIEYAQWPSFGLIGAAQAPAEYELDRLDKPMHEEVEAKAPMPMTAPEKRLRKFESYSSMSGESEDLYGQAQNYNLIDPNANIQTGFGLPNWSWRNVSLHWNGPVVKDQDFQLLLLPPIVNRTLNFLRIVLIAGLLLLFIGYPITHLLKHVRTNPQMIALFCLTGLLLITQAEIQPAQAADVIPDNKTLQQLRDKMLVPPNCLPACAQAARMRISANTNSMQLRLEIHAADTTAVPLPGELSAWSPANITVDGKKANALHRDAQGTLWIQLDKGVHQLNLQGPLPKLAHFTLNLPMIPKLVSHEINGWRLDGVHQDGRVDSQLQFSRKVVAGKEDDLQFDQSSLPPFVAVERTLRFGVDWVIETRVLRQSPTGTAIVLNVPLLDGETVTSDINVQDNHVVVNMSPQQTHFSWHSTLRKSSTVTLRASDDTDWIEIWRADISPMWHVGIKGIAPVSHTDPSQQWLPEWHPWPTESIHFAITRPVGIDGKTLTIDESQLSITTSKRASNYVLRVNFRSSQGGKHQFIMPQGTELQSVIINERVIPIRLDEQTLTLPITPGKQTVMIEWRQRQQLGTLFTTPDIQLGTDSTNNTTRIEFNDDRWILFLGGPRLGPAVLFWGVLIVLALIATGLGRYKKIPLTSMHWFLLAIGLTQVSIWWALIFVASFFALAYRQHSADKLKPWLFNSLQIGIAMLLFIAGIILIISIHQGLLGHPDMQIAGNNSYGTNLNWFADRVDDALPQSWVFSVSILWYRALMLAWALWLALAVVRWSKWAWQCYSSNGLWRSTPKPARTKPAPNPSLPDKSQH